jgi:hypothetical protein
MAKAPEIVSRSPCYMVATKESQHGKGKNIEAPSLDPQQGF